MPVTPLAGRLAYELIERAKYNSQAVRKFIIMHVFGDCVYALEAFAIKSPLMSKALPLKLKGMLSLNLGSNVTSVALRR